MREGNLPKGWISNDLRVSQIESLGSWKYHMYYEAGKKNPLFRRSSVCWTVLPIHAFTLSEDHFVIAWEKDGSTLECRVTERIERNWDNSSQEKRVKWRHLDPRPAVSVTSELVCSCSSCLFLPRPVTSLCHILFSQALPPSLCLCKTLTKLPHKQHSAQRATAQLNSLRVFIHKQE